MNTIDKFIGALETALPVVVMILVGYYCRRKNLIPREGIAGLKALVIKIIMPMILIRAYYNAPYSLDMVMIVIIMFAGCMVAFGLGFLINRLVGSKLRTLPYLITGFESGMVGYALFTILFGVENIRNFAIIDLGQGIFIFSIYIAMLLPSKEDHSFMGMVKGILTHRMFITIFIGVMIGVSGLGSLIDRSILGGTFRSILNIITAPIAAIILLVIGYELDIGKVNARLTTITVISRMIIMAGLYLAVSAAINLVYDVNEYMRWALLLIFIMPPPFIAVYVDDEDELALICPTVFIYTLFTLAAFVLISYAVA